jgi:hypothetical protein
MPTLTMHILSYFIFSIENTQIRIDANWQTSRIDHVIRYRPWFRSSMRLRIQTYNPLPEIKAWFIPDVQSTTSVYDLKEALCFRFQALKAREFRGKDLILLLDDFELLNDSPFSAVRDGDLICVKLSPLAHIKDVEMDIKQPGEFVFVYFCDSI